MKKSFENKILMMPERQKAQLRKAVSAIIEQTADEEVIVDLDPLREESVAVDSSVNELEDLSSDAIDDLSDNDFEADYDSESNVEIKTSTERVVSWVPISQIETSPYQTRRIGSDADLQELADSISSKGILSPLLVRVKANESGTKNFELIAGERRLRASILAGLKEVPAFIEDFSDRESLEVAIIENAQREDLNAIEQARAFQLLQQEFGLNQGEIAQAVGKSRALIANSIRLLQLEPEIVALIETAELSAGHGKSLLGIESSKLRVRIAKAAAKRGISVRALEDVVRKLAERSKRRVKKPDPATIASVQRVEKQLVELLQIEKASLKVEKDGVRRLSLSFPNESAWRKFMSKVRG